MKHFKIIIVLLACVLSAQTLKADQRKDLPSSKPKSGKSGAAGCVSATATIDLDINNVRTLLMNGGDMWWDRGLGVARYEVPKIDPPGSKPSVSSLFAAAIWVGGVDAAGNLRVASQTYRQNGNDYFPGPLDAVGTIDATTCTNYDRFWKVNLTDILAFKALGSHSAGNTAKAIWEWPAKLNPNATGTNGTVLSINDDLAPFIDANNDGNYDPTSGDYPAFDYTNPNVFPDQMIWWVYNDKGNIHTESSGDPIGLQVNATAFAYSTNDDVNNMTFYRYELYNKGSYTLDSAFIAQWVDPDLGCANDDYIGCDTSNTAIGSGTGLGICYNADAYDEPCPAGYLSEIPMVGIDYFEGPKDKNGKVLGMTGFYYYYNTTPSAQADPQNATQFYGYMTGTWRDGTRYTYGGDAHLGSSNTNFVYPSAPNKTGIDKNTGLPFWSMCNPTVQAGDLRIVESSGPFQLIPGSKQTVTVGVVWVRPVQYPCPSFSFILGADQKAQALFDAHFRLLDGPDAPDLAVKEYDKRLILTLDNPSISNNYGEKYMEFDNTILPVKDTVPHFPSTHKDTIESSYVFEGYQIYQLHDQSVSESELHDLSKARQVIQVDIKNGIKNIVNFTVDKSINANVPTLEVAGADQGIKHSFEITTDAFASGNTDLINHKNYYYMVIAYAYNNYRQFSDADPKSQDDPYKASRRRVKVYTGIPHIVTPENGGTVLHSKYGDQPIITREEGIGNGGNFLNIGQSTVDEIMQNGSVSRLKYDTLGGPISVKITDPKKVLPYKYEVYLMDSVVVPFLGTLKDSVNTRGYWKIVNTTTGETRYSTNDIHSGNEQIFDDWGFSVDVKQIAYPGSKIVSNGGSDITNLADKNGVIGWNGKIDVSKLWYSGIEDIDGDNEQNWIRAGTYNPPSTGTKYAWADYDPGTHSSGVDKDGDFEKIVQGSWAPYRLCAHSIPGAPEGDLSAAITPALNSSSVSSTRHKLANLASVDVVFTSDKSKWTRCVVVETDPDMTRIGGGGPRLQARKHDSWSLGVDGNGNPTYDSQTKGLSWFPGYAINLETGIRMDIIFGEDSYLISDNGNDMLWNPSHNRFANGEAKWGGRHYVYIMDHQYKYDGNDGNTANSPIAYLGNLLNGTSSSVLSVFEDAMWVNVPLTFNSDLGIGVKLLSAAEGIIPSEVKLNIRVAKPYSKYTTGMNAAFPNYPKYSFDMGDMAAETNVLDTAKSALDLINVVPNPYYAFSNYENSQLDSRIKITNLPRKCTITIYSVDGTLIRQFKRDSDGETFQDWDLKNSANIPISSGLYLIHISANGLGKNQNESAQRVVKWFGVMRPIDLNTF